jgi:phospholipase/lecithinase/hemolysin
MNVVRIIASLLTVLAILVPALTHAKNTTDYSRMTVFGDSLVDVGNLPPLLFLTPQGAPGLVIPPPTRYDRGRFSNGPNLANYIAARLGTWLRPSNTGFGTYDSVAYAHGGATTYMSNITPGGFPVPGVLGQVAQHLDSLDPDVQIDPRTLILMMAGANDYLLGLLQPANLPPVTPAIVVDNLRNAISQLYARNGRKFVVFNLPDLGKIPFCHTYGICEQLSELTAEHNTLLEQAIFDMESHHKGISIIHINVFKVLEDVASNPGRYGFAHDWQAAGPASGCLFQDPTAVFDPANCGLLETFSTDQVFWDEQHPATDLHKLIARRAWRAITRRF